MPEKLVGHIDLLRQLGNHCDVKEVANKSILLLGDFPEDSEEMIQKLSKYKRKGSDCFDATEKEIESGRANGCFINSYLPRHVIPSIKNGDFFVAYDDPLGGFDNVIFAGDEKTVSKSISDFFSINHTYGKDFVFRNTVHS